MANATGPDAVNERIQVSLAGETHTMVPAIGTGMYVPFVGTRYMELRPNGAGWRLQTIDNLEYLFEPAPPGLDPDLWLLSEIRDPIRGDRLRVYYDTSVAPCGPELNLERLEYTFDNNDQPLYQIQLKYDAWWRPVATGSPTEQACATRTTNGVTEIVYPFDRVRFDKLQFARSRTLTSVDVRARNNLVPSSPLKTIRRYALTYRPDPDTERPLLADVTVTGEEGIAGASLPVASYTYASFTDASTPEVAFGDRQARPTPHYFADTMYADSVGYSDQESYSEDGYLINRSATRQLIRDFTGDGLPDIVYLNQYGDWAILKNVARPTGPDFNTAAQTWTGPSEVQWR
jgi:hypothetical protein